MGNVNDFKLALKSDSLNRVNYLQRPFAIQEKRFALNIAHSQQERKNERKKQRYKQIKKRKSMK